MVSSDLVTRSGGTGYLPAVAPEVTPSPLPVRYLFIAVTVLEEYLRDMVTPFPASDRPFDRNRDLLTIKTIFLT